MVRIRYASGCIPCLDHRFGTSRFTAKKADSATPSAPVTWITRFLVFRELRNAAKEVYEEAGMVVDPIRLIALMDHNRHHPVKAAHEICSAFVLCAYRSGEFKPNVETVSCGWFSADALPTPLALGKTTREQVLMCLEASADPAWEVLFD